MLLHENKSNPNSQISTETSNEIKILKGISKTVNTLLINRIENGFNAENSKNNRVSSARSRYSPRYNKAITARSGRYGMFYDDLTEITGIDAITEPSDSSRSVCHKDIIQFDIFNPNMGELNNLDIDSSKWLLVAPDSSYKNAMKFNEHRKYRKNETSFDNTPKLTKNCPNSFRVPLLSIESSLHDEGYERKCNSSTLPYISNLLTTEDQPRDGNCDFLVSPDTLLLRLCHKPCQSEECNSIDIPPTSRDNLKNRNREFILHNLLKVDFSTMKNESFNEYSSPNESFGAKSSLHLTPHDQSQAMLSSNKNDGLSVYDGNLTIIEENSIVDASTSDTIMYHGYMITPDFINKIPSDDSSKLPLKEMRNVKVDRIPERDKFLNSISENDLDHINKYSSSLIIENVPILPPDLLGNVKLTNGNNIKKFLSVKSVVDPSWHGFEGIILDDDFSKENQKENAKPAISSFRNFEILDTETKFQDELTTKILESTNSNKQDIKNNLVRSLKDMDRKLIEIENISSVMERNFANSKKLQLMSKENEHKSKEFRPNEKKDKKPLAPLVFVESISSSNNNIQTQSEADITNISSNEMFEEFQSASQLTENQSSKQLILKNFPKLNLNFIENDTILSNQVKTISSETSSSFSVYDKNRRGRSMNMKKTFLMQSSQIRSKNKKERDRQMYIQRKKEAHRLAVEALNDIGLPTQISAEMPLNVIHNPTPNEMMLNQLYINECHTTSAVRHQITKDGNPLIKYKPIRHVSFINKVRLQRPEITRRKNIRNPMTYTDQLLSLQPQYIKGSPRSVPGNRYRKDLTPRSVISQDTDIYSILTDWSVPDDVKRILNENSLRDGLLYTEDLSQIQSLNSNSVIDWDQISQMLQQHDK